MKKIFWYTIAAIANCFAIPGLIMADMSFLASLSGAGLMLSVVAIMVEAGRLQEDSNTLMKMLNEQKRQQIRSTAHPFFGYE